MFALVLLKFVRYGARHTQERSGAYLFLPDGDATPIQIENTVVNIIKGPILSTVSIQLPYVHHTVTLYNGPGTTQFIISVYYTHDTVLF